MKKVLLTIFCFVSILTGRCYADLQSIEIDTSGYTDDQKSRVVWGCENIIQRNNSDKYVPVKFDGKNIYADMPKDLNLKELIDSQILLDEIIAEEQRNQQIAATEEADKQQKQQDLKDKLNISDDELETLKQLILENK